MADDAGPEAARKRLPSEFEIKTSERVHNGFFVLDRVTVTHELFAGGWCKPRTLEVAERGDAASAMLYDSSSREVILVRQFRLPTSPPFRRELVSRGTYDPQLRKHTGGWFLEAAASMLRVRTDGVGGLATADAGGPANVRPAETPEECIRKKVQKEVGYRITDLKKIAEYYSSPSGSNEKIYLYFAEVQAWEQLVEAAKDPADGASDIDVVKIDVDEFFQQLVRQEFHDPKIIIAGYWLRDHLARRLLERDGHSKQLAYRHVKTGKTIGIKTGNIADVNGVDVWVNPENTNMMMDRFFAKSISAAIRWYGATKSVSTTGREIVDGDTIADELRRGGGNRHYFGTGEVIVTGPGELRKRNGVQHIYHVAIADGYYQQGTRTDIPTLMRCMNKVLNLIEDRNRAWTHAPARSVLIPMIGTGQGGLPIAQVAGPLVEQAAAFFDKREGAKLDAIWLLAFTIGDRLELQLALDELVKTKVLEDLEPHGAASL